MVLHSLVLLAALPALAVGATVIHRKLRQRKIAACLRIGSANGIVESRFVSIGGIEQWIGIRGEDRSNPVLLILHGGPGASCSIFTPRICTWEKHFTIVHWDQRGSGKTLRRTGKHGTSALTLDRLTCDGIEVAEYVRRYLQVSKVVLMGQSFGSAIALPMLKIRPDLFSAYVGTDQNIGMVRGRNEAHSATLKRLRSAGLNKGVSALERIGPNPSRWTADDYFTNAKWTMKSDPPACCRIMQLLKSSIWYSPDHTLIDIANFSRGMHFSLEHLLPDAVRFDAWTQSIHFEMPFFIFQGERDVLTSTALAEAYFRDVTAPVKGMTLIRDSGHFAAFLRADQFLAELLARVRPLVAASESAATAVSV